MKNKLSTPLLDHYSSLKQNNMKKRMYRVELSKTNSLAEQIAIAACLSNGSGKYISLQDMESIVKVDIIRFPNTNDGVSVTVTDNVLTIDRKHQDVISGDVTVENILTITEVEIMELDKPQLSSTEAKELLSGVPTVDSYL